MHKSLFELKKKTSSRFYASPAPSAPALVAVTPVRAACLRPFKVAFSRLYQDFKWSARPGAFGAGDSWPYWVGSLCLIG